LGPTRAFDFDLEEVLRTSSNRMELEWTNINSALYNLIFNCSFKPTPPQLSERDESAETTKEGDEIKERSTPLIFGRRTNKVHCDV
jgi:hypothetical protein